MQLRIVGDGNGVPPSSSAISFHIVCMTCNGRFIIVSPAPSPVVLGGTLQRESGAQIAYSGSIVFPQGGTWRIDQTGVDLPKPDPLIDVTNP